VDADHPGTCSLKDLDSGEQVELADAELPKAIADASTAAGPPSRPAPEADPR